MSETKDEGRPSLQAILTTILSLAGFTLLYSIQSQQLSFPQQVGFASVIVLAGILLFTWVYAPSLRKWGRGLRRNEIAQRNYSDLLRFCERFRGFVSEGINTPNTVMNYIKSVAGFEAVSLLEPWHIDFISSNIEKGIKTIKPNFDNFVWAVNSLVAMVRFYDDVYVCRPATQVRFIEDSGKAKVPTNLRDDFNASRERFITFLGDFEEFVTSANKELGQDRKKAGDTWTNIHLLSTWRYDRPKAL